MIRISVLLTATILCFSKPVISQMAHVPGQILVQIIPGNDPENIVEKYAAIGSIPTGLVLGEQLSSPMNIYRLHFNNTGINEDHLLRVLRSEPSISIAQFNHFVDKRENFPNDPQIGSQWHHNNEGQTGGTVGADIGSGLAWEITTGGLTALGDTIVVCVIEGGNLNHPDLAANAWKNHNEIPNNGIDDDENGYIDDYLGWNVNSETDNNVLSGGHGTQVMGMIGATGDNDLGVVGANWDVKIMSVAGENLFDEASVVEAYTYPLIQRQLYDTTDGASGAFVVATNASWGIDNGNPEDVPIWTAFYDTLGVYGILNCGATANNNVDIDIVGDIPTGAPSDYMISVTATNADDIRSFAAFGATTIDLGAPGGGVFTTSGQNGYGSTSGTSFASPLTAGVIALLYSVPCETFAQIVHDDPQGAADLVRLALFDGVDPVGNLQGQTVTGGRLNAFNSLSILLSNCGDVCIAPLGFDYTVANDTSYTFTWSSLSEDGTTLRYRELGAEEWIVIPMEEETIFEIDSLGLCTGYEFEIASNCSEEDGELNFSGNQVVETLGCCVATQEMNTAEVTATSVLVSWAQSFNVASHDVYHSLAGLENWIFVGSFEESSAVIDGLEGCTFYDILVNPSCSEGFDEGVISTIRTKGCGACIDNEFCASGGESTDDEFIELVEIGDFSNPSGNNGGYVIFEDSGLELEAGGSYFTVLTPGFEGQSFNEFFNVWIDLDQDGAFSDDELVMSSPDASSSPVEDTLMVPTDALLGATRMRIAMKYIFNNPSLNQCEVFSFGETEDYCLTILESTLSSDDTDAFENFTVFPNPSNGIFTFSYSLNSGFTNGPINADIYDIAGKKVAQTRFIGGQGDVDLRELTDGFYIYQLLSEDGDLLGSGKLVLTK